jgi:hypothetical protein
MRRLAAFGLSLVVTAAPAPGYCQNPQSTAAPPPSASQAATPEPTAYTVLVDRLKAADRAVDFTALRRAFTETPAYHGMMMGFYQPLWRTLNARDFEGALKVADRVLQQNYVEPNAHLVAASAHQELGHREQAEFHRFIADGLLRSMTSIGDGRTPETAYQVIDISEEYALFRSMGLTVKAQSIVGPPADEAPIVDRVVVVVGRTNEERVMFFSVDDPKTIKRRRSVTPR